MDRVVYSTFLACFPFLPLSYHISPYFTLTTPHLPYTSSYLIERRLTDRVVVGDGVQLADGGLRTASVDSDSEGEASLR